MKNKLIVIAVALIAIFSSAAAVYAGPHDGIPPPLPPPTPLSIPIVFCEGVILDNE